MTELAGGLLDYMKANTGGCALLLTGVPDADAARRAMRAAVAALRQIPHPEEPDDPLPSFVSAVGEVDGGATFRFDAADAEAYPGLVERVLAAIVEAIDGTGAAGLLQPFVGDPATVRYPERPAAKPPFTMPADFPLPDDVREFETFGREGSGRLSFRSPLEAEELLAFYEERLPYEIVGRVPYRHERGPAVFHTQILEFVREGEPGYVGVTKSVFDAALYASEAAELEARGKTAVGATFGKRLQL